VEGRRWLAKRRIYQGGDFDDVPTCPKCGKLISPKKYKRHIERCGKTHKHSTRQLSPGQDNTLMRL